MNNRNLFFEEVFLIISIILNFISFFAGTVFVGATIASFFSMKVAEGLRIESGFDKVIFLVVAVILFIPTVNAVIKMRSGIKQYRELVSLETNSEKTYEVVIFSVLHIACIVVPLFFGIILSKNPQNKTAATIAGFALIVSIVYTIISVKNSKLT